MLLELGQADRAVQLLEEALPRIEARGGVTMAPTL